MITAPKSGKKATILRSTSTPALVASQVMTYTDSTTLKLSSTYSASKHFWMNSCKYPLTIRKNGVVSGGAITPGVSATVQVASFTCYIQGSLTTVAADSVAGLVVAGAGMKRYVIIYSTTGITKVTGTSGTAATTFGVSGGCPLISSTAIALCTIDRPSTEVGILGADEINLVDDNFGGREYSGKHFIKNVRPIVGRIDLHNALPLQHSGSQAAQFYWQGYNFSGNEIKVAQLRDWSLGVSQNREDTSLQGSGATSSNTGVRSYSFAFNKLVNEVSPALFAHITDPEVESDFIIKAYIDQGTSTKYIAFQTGIDIDMTLPQDDTSSSAGTGQVTGFAEAIDESS